MDVSKGFLTRVAYKKKVKASKLDCLLERRVKQHSIEERQRQQESASKPQTPAILSSTSAPPPSTPVRPRPPLKPHAIAQTFAQGDTVKLEEKYSTNQNTTIDTGVESPVVSTDDVVSSSLPSPVMDSTSKDGCSMSEDAFLLRNQTVSQNAVVKRTLGPKETNSSISGQEAGTTPDVQDSKDNATSDEPKLKVDSVCTLSALAQKCFEKTSASKPLQQFGLGENGKDPEENQVNMVGVEKGKTKTVCSPEPVSPFPQVNGNDGLGRENTLSNSITCPNNGVLSLQPKVNSIGRDEEISLDGLLKDNNSNHLVNGDIIPDKENIEVIDEGSSQTSKAEAEDKMMIFDSDYSPPVKITRRENISALGANNQSTIEHNSTTPPVKIIRMPPSPVPSAEESSLSDDFAEENSNSDPLKTTFTQITTMSTTTTTVVATETSTTFGSKLDQITSTKSSAVSTLTTMTKTTKMSGLDGQAEVVTKEHHTALSASLSKATTDPCGKISELSVAMSQEDWSSTKGRVRLLKFSRTKKTRSDTALPSYRKFVTKSNHKSIFVLPHDNLKVLARRGGFREVQLFSYNAKPAPDIWPYPSPRPTFGITWR